MNHIEEVLQQETSLTIQNAEIIVDDPASMEIASDMVLELDAMKKKVVVLSFIILIRLKKTM